MYRITSYSVKGVTLAVSPCCLSSFSSSRLILLRLRQLDHGAEVFKDIAKVAGYSVVGYDVSSGLDRFSSLCGQGKIDDSEPYVTECLASTCEY